MRNERHIKSNDSLQYFIDKHRDALIQEENEKRYALLKQINEYNEDIINDLFAL